MAPEMAGAFHAFCQDAWPHMGDPSPLTPTRYLSLLCDVLQDVALRRCPDALINIPPGHSKSVTTNVLYPAWCWTWQPTRRFIHISYDDKLVLRDAEKCRKLVESGFYQARWSLTFNAGSKSKSYYINSHGGSRRSTTIRSGVTGNHADDIIVDDPQNPTKIKLSDADEAQAEAETVRHVWDNVLPSRVVSFEKSRRIVVMQRLGEFDLSQHIIDKGKPLEHVCLPLQYDPEHPHVYARDWRTEEGELLAPERYNLHDIKTAILDELTPGAASAQYQQDPTGDGAGMFRLADFIPYLPDELPRHGVLGISIDGATEGRQENDKASKNSRWCFSGWLRSGDHIYLLDVDLFREDFDVVLDRLDAFIDRLTQRVSSSKRDKSPLHWTPHRLVIEKKSTGTSAEVMMRKTRNLHGFTTDLWSVSTSKVERAAAALPDVRKGIVHMPAFSLDPENPPTAGAWKIVRDELTKFPRGRSDDFVDTMTQMIIYWRQNLPPQGPSAAELKAARQRIQKAFGGR
jgi:hypothetical protein